MNSNRERGNIMLDVNKKADRTTAVGALQMLLGGAQIVLFGILSGALAIFMDNATLPTILLFAGLIIGTFLIFVGYGNYKVASRFRRISAAMGEATSIELSALTQKLGWSRDKLQKYINKQISRDFWPDSFLDTEKGLFILGYNPANLKTESGNQAVDDVLRTASGFIHEMTTINRSIENAELKAQVNTIIEINKQIYTYIEKNPDKSGLVRQLSNYFLPTTVKLLTSYLELQNQTVKSGNMLEAMKKVTEVIGTMEDVYKKQLDSLYSEKALDVSVEAEVLQNMVDM
jgi:hypothetical protein